MRVLPGCPSGDQQITMISADKQPRIKFLHAAVDVILFAAERMDLKDVIRHESGYLPEDGMNGAGCTNIDSSLFHKAT